jgi:hypothetical protein
MTSARDAAMPAEELEDRLYEQIGHELDARDIDKGMWTKAFAEAMGEGGIRPTMPEASTTLERASESAQNMCA